MLDRATRILAAVALLGLAACPGQAQSRSVLQPPGQSVGEAALRARVGLGERSPWVRARATATAIEGFVDPQTYRINPGDLLAFCVSGTADLAEELAVTSDGALVIPAIGVVSLADRTLAEADSLVRAAGAAAYPDARISLRLIQPGLLRVPITGQVREPGIYALLGGYRLADLLALAGGLSPGADARGIELEGRDGDPRDCDLLAWRVSGKEGGNPPLHAGDRVHVPPTLGAYRVHGAFGPEASAGMGGSPALDRPFEPEARLIPARPGDRLDFALRAAGWPGPHSSGDGVWLERAGEARRWITLAQAAGVALVPGDRIEIPFSREWIAVSGAVHRPGLYPYLPGQSVADYVFLAGGPSALGRGNGWKWVAASGQQQDAAAADTVYAGARIRVPERRTYTLATILAPLGTVVALIVSVVALTSSR